ncbi:hypothetical protein CW702_01030 [Candidatus Bathyarchaeota archaeon]|nr:MAG: hypothetical protein CW702_01030 [Candidatus Bathyarchaeota archaeon]
MPLMVYMFLKNAIEKYGRPVTTSEVEDVAKNILPMCADHVVHHLVELYSKGIISREWDQEKRTFVWRIVEDRPVEELAEKYPDLYLDSLYYHTVREALGRKVTMNDVIKILYRISKGSARRPTIKEIKSRLEEIKEK